MKIRETLEKTGLPVAYSHFEAGQKIPYIVYMGAGQDALYAENTVYAKANSYQVEYYFAKKNEKIENEIEEVLLQDGFMYSKSADVFIETEEVYVIYYTVRS